MTNPPGVSFSAIAPGGLHDVALTPSGALYAWGADQAGQLGTGAYASEATPVPVAESPGLTFTEVAAGDDHSLALTSTGTVYAWGSNEMGQLGLGLPAGGAEPLMTQVVGPGGVGKLTGVVAVTAGAFTSYALTDTGQVYAWGLDQFGQLGQPPTLGGGCSANLAVPCEDVPTPVVGLGGVGTLTGIVAIAAGASHCVALTAAGTLDAWGLDTSGQLGDANLAGLTTTGQQIDGATESSVPVAVSGPGGVGSLSGITHIAAGLDDSFALSSSGAVYAVRFGAAGWPG